MSEEIIECGVNYLSFDRALNLVPPEFAVAYQWFLKMEGSIIPRLPRGADAPNLTVPIKLAAQRGMHSPDYRSLPSRGANKRKYILSAHSTGGFSSVSSGESVAYRDADMVEHPDGTWTIEYAQQASQPGKKATDKSNATMMNNLVDGVPIAFMTRGREGYLVHGLAYVEAYNPLTGMFTLHGPVSLEAKGVNFYSWLALDGLNEEEKDTLRKADDFDGEAYVAVQTMRRRRQDVFRKNVLAAYDHRCALTNASTPTVLQAAHIDSFAKSKSHAVTNGILLRADVHLLYDAHLLTIRPDSGQIVVSDCVSERMYRDLDGMRMRFPKNSDCHPNDRLLEIHLQSYNNCQRKLGLSCA